MHRDLAQPDAQLLEFTSNHWAYRFDSRVIGQVIPWHTIGAYVLYIGIAARYVGRSDSCLYRRLLMHPLRFVATHVCFLPSRSTIDAFRQEAAWFHILGGEGLLLNKNHPAIPSGVQTECPHCSPGDVVAWRHLAMGSADWRVSSVSHHESDAVQKQE